MRVIAGELRCIIQDNEYSRFIKIDQRFILSRDVWRIIGINDTVNGITALTCKRDLRRQDDDFDNHIASKKLVSIFDIELLTPIEYIFINKKYIFKPMLIQDNQYINNADFVLEISDEGIISIDNDTILGKSIGKAVINVRWKDDNEIFRKYDISVIEGTVDLVSYRVYKIDLKNNRKDYKNFNIIENHNTQYGIDKFINGELTKNDNIFEFSIEPYDKQFSIVEQSESYIKILVKEVAHLIRIS